MWGAEAILGKFLPVSGAEERCHRAVGAPPDWAEQGREVLGQGSTSDAPSRQASSRPALEGYFHAVVTAVEQMAREPSPSREGHLERLEEIYCSLLGPPPAARGRCGGKRQAPELRLGHLQGAPKSNSKLAGSGPVWLKQGWDTQQIPGAQGLRMLKNLKVLG